MAAEIEALNIAIGFVNESKFVEAWDAIKHIDKDSQIWTQPGPATIKGVILWKYKKDLHNALRCFEAVLEADPNDETAKQNSIFVQIEMKMLLFTRATDLQREGKLQAAAEAYNDIDLDEPITNEIRFHVANNYGNTLQMLGRYQDAIKAFETAIEMQPDCLEANFNRAVLLRQDEFWDEALVSFEAALAVNEKFPQSILGRLDCLANLWRLEELHEYATQVIDEEWMDGDYHPYYFRGFALCEMEQYLESIADLELAFSIGGIMGDEFRKMELVATKAYGKHGEFLLSEGEAEEAIGYLDGAMNYKPTNLVQQVVLYNKALALIQLERIPEAVSELKDLIRKFPNNMKAREALAQLYLMLEELRPALEQLEIVLDDAEPEQANLMYNMGVTYFKLDRIEDARDTFQRTLNLDPEHELAIEALAAMERLISMKKANHRDALRQKKRDFVPGKFDGDKNGFSWSKNGPQGEGYYANFIPGDFDGDKPGYFYKQHGPMGSGYYREDEARPHFIPSATDTGPRPGYTFNPDGPLGPGYYLNDDEFLACRRNFQVQRTGDQDVLIQQNRTFDDDPEKARLQRLGWSDELINMTIRINKLRQEEVFEAGGAISTAHYVPVLTDKGTVGAENKDRERAAAQAAAEEASGSAAGGEAATTAFADPSTLDVDLAELQQPPFPAGVDPTCRELYLAASEFEALFNMTPAEWAVLPAWKKTNAKKKLSLF